MCSLPPWPKESTGSTVWNGQQDARVVCGNRTREKPAPVREGGMWRRMRVGWGARCAGEPGERWEGWGGSGGWLEQTLKTMVDLLYGPPAVVVNQPPIRTKPGGVAGGTPGSPRWAMRNKCRSRDSERTRRTVDTTHDATRPPSSDQAAPTAHRQRADHQSPRRLPMDADKGPAAGTNKLN